ncbi:MAG: hypothetical protein KDA90_05145 [Planctomycetaceae bacterium]|nr:hypothetical protein [Planctomycetaceae bacterium]
MAILSLVKVTLLGTTNQKDLVLDELQAIGCLHLIDLGPGNTGRSPVTSISDETRKALRFLRSCPTRRRPAPGDRGLHLESVVQRALQIAERQEELQRQCDELIRAIDVLRPWGDFHLPDHEEFGDLRFWFYVVPHYKLRLLTNLELMWQVVSRDQHSAYVIVIAPDQPQQMPVPPVDLAPHPLSTLRQAVVAAELELEESHWERVALTRWIGAIQQSIAHVEDQAARELAARQLLDDRPLFAIQGWTPRRGLERVRTLAQSQSLALTIEPPDCLDSPPTLLENPTMTAGGQDAVTFYTTPAYTSWDPSGIVFISFSLFFAMIMADAGYALVLGGLLLLLWRRLGRSMAGRGFRNLALSVILASVTYGVLIGSYFGRPPAASSYLHSMILLDAADTNLMMRISISLGVLHLTLANLAVAWNLRWSLRMLSSVGWMALLMGGLAYGLGRFNADSWELMRQIGQWGLICGAVLVLLFSSERSPWTLSLKTHAIRLVDGVMSLTSVTRAFGDVLSYLRLFALGLASAQLAATFNDLAYQASCCIGVGSLLAILVVTLGHGLNLVLAVMSGVVHGLRLNCIEFFGWGLPEEGYPFHPFSRKAI